MRIEHDPMTHVVTVLMTEAEALKSPYRDKLPPHVRNDAENILLRAAAASAPKPDSILDAEIITKLDQ